MSVTFEIRIKRNKTGKGIDLKLYNVTFIVWINHDREIMIDILVSLIIF